MHIPRFVCWRLLFACLAVPFLIVNNADAARKEPVNFKLAVEVQPLKKTDDTTLLLNFDAKGQPVVQPADLKASLVGAIKPLPKIDLPNFSGGVQLLSLKAEEDDGAATEESAPKKSGKKAKATSYVEVANGAGLLGQGAFTIDIVLRFSLGDGNFFEAGPDAAFQWGVVDRDAGMLTVRTPGGVLSANGVYEKVGPLARDRFERMTLTYDGAGTFAYYIDGTECHREKLANLEGPLKMGGGPLRVGDVTPAKAHFFGDVAALRIQKGVHAPEPAAVAPVASGGVAGWAFDVSVADAPAAIGYQKITKDDVFGGAKTYGWTVAPVGTADLWFLGERYTAAPEQVIKSQTRRARAWQFRDAVLVPSGEGFAAKLPPGLYAVTATLGRADRAQYVDSVEANGKVIGTNLITLTDRTGDSQDRTARDFVEVGADGVLRITATSREMNGKRDPVGFMSVTVLPVAPLPVNRDGSKLVWKGAGAAPAGFEEANKAYEARDFAAAFDAAGKISDLLARASTRAWIVGFPELTDLDTLDRVAVIHDDLLAYLREHPEDLTARYLENITLTFWHAAEAYVFQRPTSRIFGALKGRAWREGLNLALQLKPDEPYWGHARLLAGNFIWQFGQQSGGGYIDDVTWRKPVKHEAYLPPPPIFREVLAAYPESTLPRVFLSKASLVSDGGEPTPDDGRVPVAKQIAIPANAPEWAALQHRAITRLVDAVAYWHDKRMIDNGTMGGGFGDDVEMMRWWKTSLLVADDQKALDGWERLAALGWKMMRGQPMPEQKQDAEHVAEDFADSHGLQPILQVGGDQFETYMGRSKLMIPIVRDVLTTRDAQGYLVFKNWSYSRVDGGQPKGDVPYNIRTILPLCIYAYMRPEDKDVAQFVIDYARNWRDMTMQEIDGKPAGITPMMINHDRKGLKQPKADGRLVQQTDWTFPGYWSFEYPGGYTNHIYDICLGAYFLSGDKSFLEPHKQALELLGKLGEGGTAMSGSTGAMGTGLGRGTGTGDYDESKFPRGSLDWAIRINHAGLGMAGAQYRMATGDESYDDVLLKHGPAYTKYVILAERAKTPEQMAEATKALTPMLNNILNYVDYNEVLYTRLPQSTDRVWMPGMDFLESTATGDISAAPPPAMRGEEEVWPTFGVTWKKTGPDVSVLISKNDTTRLEGYLYNFLEQPKAIQGHLWNLAPGKYRLKVTASPDFKDGQQLVSKEFEVKGKGQTVDLDVPSQQQCRFVIEPAAG